MACTFIAPICNTRGPYSGILYIRQPLRGCASLIDFSMKRFRLSSFCQPPCSAAHLMPSGLSLSVPSSFLGPASLVSSTLHISVVNTRCSRHVAPYGENVPNVYFHNPAVARLACFGCGLRVGSVVPRSSAYLCGSQGSSSHQEWSRRPGQDDHCPPIEECAHEMAERPGNI